MEFVKVRNKKIIYFLKNSLEKIVIISYTIINRDKYQAFPMSERPPFMKMKEEPNAVIGMLR